MDPKITAKYKNLPHHDPFYIAYQTALKIEEKTGKKVDQHFIDKITPQIAKFTNGKDPEYLDKAWDNISEALAKSMIKNKTFATNFRSGFHIASSDLNKVIENVDQAFAPKHNKFVEEKQVFKAYVKKYQQMDLNNAPNNLNEAVKAESLKAVGLKVPHPNKQNVPSLPTIKIQAPLKLNKDQEKEQFKQKVDKFLEEMKQSKLNGAAQRTYKHLEYHHIEYLRNSSNAGDYLPDNTPTPRKQSAVEGKHK